LIIFVFICILLRFLVNDCIVFMDSAGKRKNTEGTGRGKRKLDEKDDSEAESSKKPKLDDSDSDLTSLDSAEIEELAKSIEDSPEPQPTQADPSPAPAPSPAPDSAPVPAPDSAPGASQPTPMGPPRNPLSPPSLTDSAETPTEHYLPDGEGIPVEGNDA
jgi:hypothetical protein